MDHKIKRKWCAALCGGTWTQIRGHYYHALQDDNGRCAVGVLGEVLGAKRGSFRETIVDHLVAAEQGDVVMMNDSGKSFLEIADWIEKNL